MKLWGRKRGMTLIELMVAIVIMSLVMTASPVLYMKILQSQRFVIEENTARSVASQGVSRVSKVLWKARQSDHGSFPITLAQKNEIIVYSNVDEDSQTERVHFYLTGNSLMMGVRNPDMNTSPPTYASGDEFATEITPYAINSSQDIPVFTYFDGNNNELAYPANQGAVRMVKIRLYINIEPMRQPESVNVEEIVSIRNLNEYNKVY